MDVKNESTVSTTAGESVSTTTALELRGVSVTLAGRPVLRDVSCVLPKGSVLAVIGPNGAGKTVLFKALIGMLPAEGAIAWAPGTRIGYVPQKLDIERDLPLTARDFLHAKMAVSGAAPDAIPRALKAVGLGSGAERDFIGALSGGQFQRLMLACALIGDPDTLLLDEVTAGVDEPGQEQMYDLIDRFAAAKQHTILLISHELSVVYRQATHVLCLGQGRSWFGPPIEVLTPDALHRLYGSTAHHTPMTFPPASALVVAVTMAVAAGLVGAYALMRRLTLAADAISHVALPGIGLALIIHVQPILGALVMLLLGASLIWDLGRRTRLATETIIGVVFATALAVGSMITSGEELIDALFGAPSLMSRWEAVLGIVASLGVVAYILWRHNQLVLSLVSREVAHTAGVNVDRLDLEYLLVFALTIALGLRYLGALLMGSLIIIPPAAARRLAGGLLGMLVISALVAVAATVTGMFVAPLLGQKTGPVIVVAASSLFFLSLIIPRKARRSSGVQTS